MVAMKASISTIFVLAVLPAALAGPVPEPSSTKLAARDFTARTYEDLATADRWNDPWWDQQVCAANTFDNTWSWVVTIPNARATDGSACGRSYMRSVRDQCDGPIFAWACRYVGTDSTTAYIDIAADQSCTIARVQTALNTQCMTYSDDYGAGGVSAEHFFGGTWRWNVVWDNVWWPW